MSILFFVASICLSRRLSCKLACVRDSAETAAAAATTSKNQPASETITCSPIISHFRLKNASLSSVVFLAKYLRCQRHQSATSATRCKPRDTSSSPRADLDHGMSHVLEVAAHVKRRRQRHKHCRRGGGGGEGGASARGRAKVGGDRRRAWLYLAGPQQWRWT